LMNQSGITCNTNDDDNVIIKDPNAYLGKALVVLTESPTYDLCGWATKTYQLQGNIKRMINRGVHSDDEWMNVIFQLLVALYVCQIYGIIINDFALDKNVFIKDMPLRGTVTNYWKFVVDDVEYYLPNLGYLVMLDSNFRDITVNTNKTTLASKINNTTTTNTEKLAGKFIDPQMNDGEIIQKTFEMLTKAFDLGTFGQSFVQNGGCPPTSDAKRIIDQINIDIRSNKTKDIGAFIIKYMRKYLHNRIGLYLKETEISNIRKDDTRQFTKGQILVNEDGYGTYKFVLLINVNNGKAKIITKNKPGDEDFIEKDIPVTSLFNYSKAEIIGQNFKPNEANMNEDDLIETYVIRKD